VGVIEGGLIASRRKGVEWVRSDGGRGSGEGVHAGVAALALLESVSPERGVGESFRGVPAVALVGQLLCVPDLACEAAAAHREPHCARREQQDRLPGQERADQAD
jgi:hypothetical protein